MGGINPDAISAAIKAEMPQLGDSVLANRRTALISVVLFGINAVICGPLFGVEYLDDFQSNEGAFITFGNFLLRYWPHVSWFPWFNAGMPLEDAYPPLTPFFVAVVSLVGSCSPAHAFHFVVALTYSLAPVFLFLFALGISGRLVPSLWASLLWSLTSPSVIFPQPLHDLGTPWSLRRLETIVFYGESPHNLAICLLPISLLLTWRYLEKRTLRRFGLAALAAAAVMLTNTFGIVAVCVSSVILFAIRKRLCWNALGSVAGILFVAYLAMCRFLPPRLIGLLETNSQLAGGDYRFTVRTIMPACCFLAVLVALWGATCRLSNPMLRFALLFSTCFGGIVWLGYLDINLLPQPLRYHLEMEPGVCLLTVFLLELMVSRVPASRAIRASATVLCAALLGWIAIKDYRFARNLIHPVDIVHSAPFRQAQWISTHLPGQRVLVSGEGQWLFNLFSDNPQLSAGHEPSAPNWVQRVAVHTIFSGENAGEQDGPISILWLKAFGCGGIVVPGRDSKDHYHTIANPDKFEGLLPLVWRESGDSIYQIPLSSTSLAHVVPRSVIVKNRPLNGLDVEQLRPYVAALESPAIPPAKTVWENPGHASIVARMDSSDVISVQVTYDPGWQARIAGRKVKTTADKLGFVVIDPECVGDCSIDLTFTGGLERGACLTVSSLVVLGLLAMIFWPIKLVDGRAKAL
jgi:hypothetical protein